ncbi:hypothetical protein [Streptomyces sp. NPDC003015]
MTPHAAISAFNYLRAVQADDATPPASSPAPNRRLLLVDIATRIVVPVTAIRAMHGIDPEPVDDSFALEALGRVFVSSLRAWAQAGPDAAEGIARVIIDFATQFFTEDHEDVTDVLRQLEEVGVGQALDAHPAPAGAHPVRHTAV